MLIQIIDLSITEVALKTQEKKADFHLLRHPEMKDNDYIKQVRTLNIDSNTLIVHSKQNVAKALNAYALHLRFDDYLKRRKIYKRIGVSVHTLDELKIIERNDDVDYIFISPIYETKSKPGAKARGLVYLDEARKIFSGKIIALGGINDDNIKKTHYHADGIASIRYFL